MIKLTTTDGRVYEAEVTTGETTAEGRVHEDEEGMFRKCLAVTDWLPVYDPHRGRNVRVNTRQIVCWWHE